EPCVLVEIGPVRPSSTSASSRRTIASARSRGGRYSTRARSVVIGRLRYVSVTCSFAGVVSAIGASGGAEAGGSGRPAGALLPAESGGTTGSWLAATVGSQAPPADNTRRSATINKKVAAKGLGVIVSS